MIEDPIVEEVRNARQGIFAEVAYDLRRLGERLRRNEQAHPERLAHLPPQTGVLKVLSGVVQGKTVVLDSEPGLADGQRVHVFLRLEEDLSAGSKEMGHQAT